MTTTTMQARMHKILPLIACPECSRKIDIHMYTQHMVFYHPRSVARFRRARAEWFLSRNNDREIEEGEDAK